MSDSPDFVHLRLHSEYSVTDGIVRLDQVTEQAGRDGQGALALTDLGNLFGFIKFYKAARSQGIKPLCGCDVWISNPTEREKPTRLLLLACNRQGYLALCHVISRAWIENQIHGRPEILLEWFAQFDTAGLIALSGAQQGDVGIALANGQIDLARQHAQRWARWFPERFYLEVQRYAQPGAEAYIAQVLPLAAQLDLPVVATHPVQFLSPHEFQAHEARVCIAQGETLGNPKRSRSFTPEQYFKSQTEMASLFADIPSALANSVQIARRCNLTLELGKPCLPIFPTPASQTLDDYLVAQAQLGLERRLEHLYPDPTQRDQQRWRYLERMQFETATIIKMGFASYFLIVADFINWAKNNGVPVGPGRGSGAGSLVAYCLGITDLDPLAYHLLFERFLNPERVSMPDFDIDFCQEGRDRVIDYVRRQYGAECVAQIATFGTMAAKAAVRDIGRVLDLPFNFVDGIAKLIPFKPGKLVTLADACKEEPLLAERKQNEEEVRELLALAEQVEGLTRNLGMHAGGVLIAPGKLTDFTPLYTQEGSQSVVSQYDKDDVEAVGLVKFDFLGLTTLTILNWSVESIRRLYADQAEFTLEQLALDDAATYQVLQRADTVAVFQLESRGMQAMLKEAKPDRFEDIIALVALYRPGPMDLIPDFVARKKGERFAYPDPRVKPILEETYGIMVYQEQVMQMAQVIGGYSLGAADLLRRAMGKKKPEEMAQQRAIFAAGAAQNGLSQAKANELFDLMEKFAGYGFNKSHAAAYALLAYQTAWLKAHYPAEFMAANLSAAMADTDKVKILFDDSRALKLSILPPSVNFSEYRFMPVLDNHVGKPTNTIRYGLGAIKGSGQSAIQSIVAARQEKPYSDLYDFCQRVDKRLVNRRVIEALVKAGALDDLSGHAQLDRANLLAAVEAALNAAEQAQAHLNQVSLFGENEHASLKPLVKSLPAWSDQQKLSEEKNALGFYFSGHLFDTYATEVRRFVRTKLADLKAQREAQLIAGVIVSVRSQMIRRGKMLVVLIDDHSAQVEVTIFSELAEINRDCLREDRLLIVHGQVRHDEFSGGLRVTAERIFDLARARSQYARAIKISIATNLSTPLDIKQFKQLLTTYRLAISDSDAANGCPVVIGYRNHNTQCELALGRDWRMAADETLVANLKACGGIENVEFEYL